MNETVVPGAVLLGKYRVERILGQGGMGVVVAVRHIELGQLYAMKFLLPTAVGNEESHERFVREAKAAARLTSDHVVRVQDVGRMDNGAPYMLMEYLEGCDLKALVARHGPLSVEDAVTDVIQVTEAIAEAHALGIVHRDLKPANLFLARRRNTACVKVLDFGISKQMDPQGVDLTNTSATLGSPLYMSPEQMAKSKLVDARTDIWALGVILYELLAGTSPFRGDSIYEVTSRVLQDEPTPLRELRADVPTNLEALISKCLRKRREERFQSVEELRAELRQFVHGADVGTRPPLPLAPLMATTSASTSAVVAESNPRLGITKGGATTTTFGQTGKPTVPKQRRPRVWVGLGTTLVVAIAGAAGIQRWMHVPPAIEAASSSVVSAVPVVGASLAMPIESARVDVLPPREPTVTVVVEKPKAVPEKPKSVLVKSVPTTKPTQVPVPTSVPTATPTPTPMSTSTSTTKPRRQTSPL